MITKVALLAAQRPRNARVALLAAADFDGVRALVRRAREELGEVVYEQNLSRRLVDAVRKRKGIAVDEKIVMHAEKQRNRARKK